MTNMKDSWDSFAWYLCETAELLAPKVNFDIKISIPSAGCGKFITKTINSSGVWGASAFLFSREANF